MAHVKEDLEERLAFLGWNDTDRQLLCELAPLLDRHGDRFVSAFYRHLLSFAGTRGLLVDSDVKDRLLHKQRQYLTSLGDDGPDPDYATDRLRIGEVHERIGLEPRWYLGAYALYFALLAPLVADAHRDDPARVAGTLVALVKRLLLDAQFAIEAYIGRHDQHLEHLNQELAETSRSLAREHEATEHALRRTERRARAAEDLASVATLVAGLAHEIGTPMGVIRGHAEALEGVVSGEKAQWRLRTIREQIDRISTIIQSLLNIARPKQILRIRVDIVDVIDRALAFLSEKLRLRSVVVERRFEGSPIVLGDPDKLQQLFLNLFLNAVDAMPEGGVLRVGVRETPTGEVELLIGDTGVGIPPTDLRNVFEPFFTTKPAGRGSGLGLVVAEGIISDHGGQIVVESEVGRGTQFSILLPAAQAATTPPGR